VGGSFEEDGSPRFETLERAVQAKNTSYTYVYITTFVSYWDDDNILAQFRTWLMFSQLSDTREE
jgi:hypothetical protein